MERANSTMDCCNEVIFTYSPQQIAHLLSFYSNSIQSPYILVAPNQAEVPMESAEICSRIIGKFRIASFDEHSCIMAFFPQDARV